MSEGYKRVAGYDREGLDLKASGSGERVRPPQS